MLISGLILSTCLVAFALLWALTGWLSEQSILRRSVGWVVSLPAWLWMGIGVAAFVLPVFEYWITAKSHGNALAGYLPWADATEYYECSQAFLLGLEAPAHCGKRSYYVAFMTDLLWLTGNKLQLALLLQALLVGSSVVVFSREVARSLNGPAALATYAVLYQFAAVLCASLVMTENIGLLMGTLGLALLWRGADRPVMPLFLAGIALLAAGLAARPGPMFVLPALIAWHFLYAEGATRERLMKSGVAIGVAALAIGLTAIPIAIAGGTLGSTHSNFSYALYGLAAGGENWLQVTIDHPEIYELGGGQAQTDRVYELAIESILTRPHLFVLGYVKGIGHYLDDLFRYASEFKPLRLALFLPLWLIGVWTALRKWREPRYALLIALQAGLLVSAPFIAIDGQNRVFAATVAVDAIFVALGMVWVSQRLIRGRDQPVANTTLRQSGSTVLAGTCMAALLVPVAMLAAVQPNRPLNAYASPACEAGQDSIVVRPGGSTLVLPLVEPGEESVMPLRARADHFVERFPKWVNRKHELMLPAGTTLLWGIRLDAGAKGRRIYFRWPDALPPSGNATGFCVEREPREHIGTAVAIHAGLQ